MENSDTNYLENCVFVDKAGFNINKRSPHARSIRGTPAILETPSTRTVAHTILGAVSAKDVMSIQIRESLKPKKLKVDSKKTEKIVPAKQPINQICFT